MYADKNIKKFPVNIAVDKEVHNDFKTYCKRTKRSMGTTLSLILMKWYSEVFLDKIKDDIDYDKLLPKPSIRSSAKSLSTKTHKQKGI